MTLSQYQNATCQVGVRHDFNLSNSVGKASMDQTFLADLDFNDMSNHTRIA